jgi:hypothetical protein
MKNNDKLLLISLVARITGYGIAIAITKDIYTESYNLYKTIRERRSPLKMKDCVCFTIL